MIRTSLALAMALALAACGNQDSTAPNAAGTDVPPPPPVDAPAEPAVNPLDAAIASSARSPEFVARDAFRHPAETLTFFLIAPDQTVIEVTPGGGWYAEILAPYLKESGRYVAAIIDENTASSENAKNYYARTNQALRDKFAAAPDVFGAVEVVSFDPMSGSIGAPESADLVLTFRNVHNWMGTEGQADAMFKGFFSALKPGGMLGVVEHRAAEDVPAGDRSGYVSEAQVVALAEAAGFMLDYRSEINANPADTKDHPNGVWTLPPSSRIPEGEDGAKYQAIGESDRMTLRFIKPR